MPKSESKATALHERIRELEAERDRLARELAAAADRLRVPASELPVDHKGPMPRRLVVSLRPDLRRRVMGLYNHLRAIHATMRHPRYHNQTRHVDDPSHVVTWLLERVVLTGEQSQKEAEGGEL